MYSGNTVGSRNLQNKPGSGDGDAYAGVKLTSYYNLNDLDGIYVYNRQDSYYATLMKYMNRDTIVFYYDNTIVHSMNIISDTSYHVTYTSYRIYGPGINIFPESMKSYEPSGTKFWFGSYNGSGSGSGSGWP